MLNKNTYIPLYSQLTDTLIHNIQNDTYPIGSALPSERKISELYGISRITVRKALEYLETQGYIEKKQGKKTLVKSSHPEKLAIDNINTQFMGIIEELKFLGVPSFITVLETGFISPSNSVREYLKLSPHETEVFVFSRLYSDHCSPILYNNSYVNAQIGLAIKDLDFSHDTILMNLTSLGYQVGYTDCTVSVANANEMDRRILNIERNTPIMIITRIVFSPNGTPILCSKTYCRPDRYSYKIALKR